MEHKTPAQISADESAAYWANPAAAAELEMAERIAAAGDHPYATLSEYRADVAAAADKFAAALAAVDQGAELADVAAPAGWLSVQRIPARLLAPGMILIKDHSGYDGTVLAWVPGQLATLADTKPAADHTGAFWTADPGAVAALGISDDEPAGEMSDEQAAADELATLAGVAEAALAELDGCADDFDRAAAHAERLILNGRRDGLMPVELASARAQVTECRAAWLRARAAWTDAVARLGRVSK